MYPNQHFLLICCVIFSTMTIGSALECYICDSKSSDSECARGSSSLPTQKCVGIQNRCGTFIFNVLKGHSKLLGTGYQRGCAFEGGYCELVEKGADALLRGSTRGEVGIEQVRCDLCETDYCNSSGTHTLVARIHVGLKTRGDFEKRAYDTDRPRTVRTVGLQENVLEVILEHPETSTRRIAQMMNARHVIVWHILKQFLLYPFYIQTVPALSPQDSPFRMVFLMD